MIKAELVNRYNKKRRINNDIYSDTYRGGMDDYSYRAYSFNDIKNIWINSLKKDNDTPIDFYLHIPFCFTLCKYCDYYKELIKTDSIDNYLEYIFWYLGEYKDIFKGKKFRSMYIGGGSPSLLSDKQIDFLLGYIFSNFEFEENGEMTFEVNPTNITKKRAEVLSKYPINRISMGVQSVDPKVLEESNRGYQRENSVEKAVKILREYSFDDINGDVIMGLKEDTVESMDNTIKSMISMGFSSIVLYRLLPTDEYLDEHFRGSLEEFYKDVLPKIKLYNNHIKSDILSKYDFEHVNMREENGYRWDLVMKKSKVNKYDDFSQASLFGIGPSARSHIYGHFYYKTIDSTSLQIDEESVIYTGKDISIEDEEALYIIKSFTNNDEINMKEYFSLYGNDFLEKYHEIINILKKENYCKIEGNIIKTNVTFQEKNYYALFFLTDEELTNRIDFLERRVSQKIIFKNGLKIGLNFSFKKGKINYTIYNYYSIKKSNIKFFYSFVNNLDLIVSKINKLYLSGVSEKSCTNNILKIVLISYKKFISKVNKT